MHALAFLALVPMSAPPADAGLETFPDGAFLLTVQPAKLFATPSGKALLKVNPMVEMLLGGGLGLDPSQVERVSVYHHPDLAEPVLVVSMANPIEIDRLPEPLREGWQAWITQGDVAEQKRRGCRYFRDETTWRSVLFLTGRVVVLGDTGAVEVFHDRVPGKAEAAPERPAAKPPTTIAAARDNAVVLFLDLGAYPIDGNAWPAWPSKQENHLAAAAPVKRLLLSLAVDEQIDLSLWMAYPGGKEEAARDALVRLKAHVADVLAEGREELLDRVSDHHNAETRDLRNGMAGFLATAERALRKAKVELADGRVSLEARLDGPDALASGAMFLLGAAMRTQVYHGPPPDPNAKRLGRVARALADYRKDHGTLPPAYTTDVWGRPLLSWRVLLLPYLGEAEAKLFAEFRPDEPWDGEHNLRLLGRMPDAYDLGETGRPTTTLQAVVGKDAAFEGGQAKGRPLLVAAAKAVPWSKPKDAASGRPAVGLLPDGTIGPTAAPTPVALPGLPGLSPR